MILYEIALARTKKGKLELVAVEYETIGRMTKPTKQAEKLLEKYASWRNLCTRGISFDSSDTVIAVVSGTQRGERAFFVVLWS